MIVLQTSRLFIRQLRPEDLGDSIEHRTDPEVCKYIASPMTMSEVKNFVKDHSKPWSGKLNEHLALAVLLKSQNKLIGELKVQYTDLTENIVEIGFRFNKNYHKKGYALETVKALVKYLFLNFMTNKITAICINQNTNSYRLMEKLGMQPSAQKPPPVEINGIEMVQLEYFITKKMWETGTIYTPEQKSNNNTA